MTLKEFSQIYDIDRVKFQLKFECFFFFNFREGALSVYCAGLDRVGLESEMEWESAPDPAFDAPLPKVEPPEEDPLSGAVSPSQEDLTVPSRVCVTVPPVPTPQTTPRTIRGVQLVSLSDLLQKPSGGSQKVPTSTSNNLETESNERSLNISVPGGQVVNIPLNVLQNALSSATGQPQIASIATSTTLSSDENVSNQPIANSTPQNVSNSSTELESINCECDPAVLQIKDESIEDELSELLVIKKPVSDVSTTQRTTKPGSNDTSEVVQSISLPGGNLLSIPMSLLRRGSSNVNISLTSPQTANNYGSVITPKTTSMPDDQTRTTLTSSQTASSSTINQSVAMSTQSISSILPGTNMAVFLTPNGNLVASPVTSSVTSSLPYAGKPSFTSVQNLECTGGISKSEIRSIPAPRTTGDRKYSTITILNSSSAYSSNASRTAAETAKPTSRTHLSKQIVTDLLKNVPPVTSGSSLSNTKASWPPPSWAKRKLKSKTPLPLSGSWTNPNPPSVRELTSENTEHHQSTMYLPQPESDPLDGPVQDIRPYPSQPSKPEKDLTIGTFITIDPYESNPSRFSSSQRETPVKHAKAVQCCIFPPTSLRESAAEKEPPALKRPIMRPISRGIGIGVQAKLILYNVFKYFEQRKAHYNLRYTVTEVTENATGVKTATLRKIMREAKKTCNSNDPRSIPTFKAPRKRGARVKTVLSNIHIDSALRRYIHEYLLKKKESPGLKYLKSKCLLDGLKAGKHMGMNFIRLRMKKLGFVTVRTNRRLISVEGAPVRTWRYKYLKQMKTSTEEKKNIVFTFAVNLREIKQSATDWEVLDGYDEIKEESRVLTVFHAADKNGLIEGGFFINDTNVDPQNPKDAKWYFEWLELHVLKKVREGSVVVLAHDKYHELVDREPKPNAGCSKKEVVDWLRSRVVGDIDETLPKCALLEKASRIPVKQKYKVDSLVETYGHTPVHLPPSQKDLNPIEYVWDDIRAKFLVRGKLKTVKGSLASEFSSADSESRLKRAWKQVPKCEDTYRKNDPLLDDAQEAAIRKLGGMYSSPSNGPLPDETGEDIDVDLNSSDSDSSGSDSSGESKSASGNSGSDSNSDSDSETSEDDDSEESESSESTSSGSEDSEEDVPLSERIKGLKRRKLE